ncbi:glyoxalase domain-containing protein 4-like [Artemia franciscana]|uniref:VOC domain-containing protein n=1 Tax=Artemia franciscana TaxID=6661 RepID=A0AA88H8J7_ARTSF|nr:hypothetical protein QYM36_017527 [Artemia franciscana]
MNRALHFVFKIGDRKKTVKFFKDVLGMQVLRHEEFEEGCKASCNGPYDGKWSKTMVGFGPEDDHFVMELTYNYGISTYKMGNDFIGITIRSKECLERAAANDWPILTSDSKKYLECPGGYKFFIEEEPQPRDSDPVVKIALASSNVDRSLKFWNELLQMKIYEKKDNMALLGFADNQAKLCLIDIGGPVDHAKAFGRIAFSCPAKDLPAIQAKMDETGNTVLTRLVSLDTPGKATVQVVILADPDGHEICFVGDEAFRELSKVDPKGDALLTEAMENDKSDEWFAQKGKGKGEA